MSRLHAQLIDKNSDMALLRSLVDMISDITTQHTTYIHTYIHKYSRYILLKEKKEWPNLLQDQKRNR